MYDDICNYYNVPIDEGYECIYPFDLMAFCAQYKLPSLSTYNALKILQLSRVLEVTDEQETKARVLFIVTRDSLYDIPFSPLEDAVVMVLHVILRTSQIRWAHYTLQRMKLQQQKRAFLR